ncbi:MAG TPA: hypothetical protein VKZ58_02510 [Longimicrobiales bacterium]|nr:hypothetical protein [Longimicrobiales bacterium]
MEFVIGFAIWLVIGLVAGFLARATYRAADTVGGLTMLFAIFGAFVGGMLGVSAYIYHNPVPTRPGAMIGAVLGAFFFSYLYHFIARKAV